MMMRTIFVLGQVNLVVCGSLDKLTVTILGVKSLPTLPRSDDLLTYVYLKVRKEAHFALNSNTASLLQKTNRNPIRILPQFSRRSCLVEN